MASSSNPNPSKSTQDNKRQSNEPPMNQPTQKRQTTATVANVSFAKTASLSARKKYLSYFLNRPLHGERGIDYDHVSKEVKAIIDHHHWEKFVEDRTEDFNLSMVTEFYAVLSDYSSYDQVTEVKLRNTVIPFTPEAINDYFGIPDMPIETVYSRIWNIDSDDDLALRAEEARKFLVPESTWLGRRFLYGSARKDVRVLKHLVSHNLFPSFKVNTFNYEEACLTYAIMTKVPVDIGRIIHRKAGEFAIKMKKKSKMPFPFLISDLCMQAMVKKLRNDVVCAQQEPTIGPHIKELDEESSENEAEPSSPRNEPINDPISEPTAPILENSQFQVLQTEVLNLKSEVAILKNGMMNLSENVVLGFENVTKALNDLRAGIRGHREYHVRMSKKKNDGDFINCQVENYVAPEWIPIIPPSPPPTSEPIPPPTSEPIPHTSESGGSTNILSAGATLVQSGIEKVNDGGASSSSAPTGQESTGTEKGLNILADLALQHQPVQFISNPPGSSHQGAGLIDKDGQFISPKE